MKEKAVEKPQPIQVRWTPLPSIGTQEHSTIAIADACVEFTQDELPLEKCATVPNCNDNFMTGSIVLLYKMSGNVRHPIKASVDFILRSPSVRVH